MNSRRKAIADHQAKNVADCLQTLRTGYSEIPSIEAGETLDLHVIPRMFATVDQEVSVEDALRLN